MELIIIRKIIMKMIIMIAQRHEFSNEDYLGTRLTESPMRRFETRLLTRVSRTWDLNFDNDHYNMIRFC